MADLSGDPKLIVLAVFNCVELKGAISSGWVKVCRRLGVWGSSASCSAILLGEIVVIRSATVRALRSGDDDGEGVGRRDLALMIEAG